MGSSFFTGTDAELYTGSTAFLALIAPVPATYGLTGAQTVLYANANTAYGTAYLAAINPVTRTRARIATKNSTRKALKVMASDLAKIIDATPTVTDAQKLDLGIAVRKIPSPVPAPTSSPDIDIISTSGRTVKIRLHDSDSVRRGKPAGVDGAAVLSYVGATPPADTSAWKFETNISRTTVDIVFGADVPNGATVWFSAFWIGSRMESGPASNPVSANIPGGMTMAA